LLVGRRSDDLGQDRADGSPVDGCRWLSRPTPIVAHMTRLANLGMIP
jgi:hypothetical protein